MESIIGKTILGYKVQEKIGTGGFGDVYRVERNNIVGNVNRALKLVTLPKDNQYIEVLNSMGGDYEKADKYFRQELDRVVDEIRVFAMLSEKDNHNIVSYYENEVEEVGKHKYNIYILMEYLTPLDKWLQSNNLTVEKGLEIGISIANALNICHENKIMHRDVKLNNVFVSKDGKFKLGDFGVSKRLDTMTRANTIKGTPHYIAPEVYIGKEKYNNSVDIYSLGMLMYYLFNKRRFPFYPEFPLEYDKNDEDRAFYRRMKYEEIIPPVSAPDSISKIILKSLSRPKERYTDVKELIADLEKAKEELPKEILEEKIGFEPIKKEEEEQQSSREDKLVENLKHANEVSISFREQSLKTFTGNETDTSNQKKIRIAVAVAVCFAILLLVAIKFGFDDKNKESKQASGTVKTSETVVEESLGEAEDTTENNGAKNSAAEDGEELNNTEESDDGTTGPQDIANSIVEVGEYENKKYSVVAKELKTLGFEVEKKEKYSDSVKKGYIIEQSISAGTQVVAGTKIVLTVSNGEKQQETAKTPTTNAPQNNNQSSDSGGNSDSEAGFDFGEIIE